MVLARPRLAEERFDDRRDGPRPLLSKGIALQEPQVWWKRSSLEKPVIEGYRGIPWASHGWAETPSKSRRGSMPRQGGYSTSRSATAAMRIGEDSFGAVAASEASTSSASKDPLKYDLTVYAAMRKARAEAAMRASEEATRQAEQREEGIHSGNIIPITSWKRMVQAYLRYCRHEDIMIAKQPLVVDPDVLHLQVEQSLQEDASEVQGSATIGSGEEEVAEEAEDAEVTYSFPGEVSRITVAWRERDDEERRPEAAEEHEDPCASSRHIPVPGGAPIAYGPSLLEEERHMGETRASDAAPTAGQSAAGEEEAPDLQRRKTPAELEEEFYAQLRLLESVEQQVTAADGLMSHQAVQQRHREEVLAMQQQQEAAILQAQAWQEAQYVWALQCLEAQHASQMEELALGIYAGQMQVEAERQSLEKELAEQQHAEQERAEWERLENQRLQLEEQQLARARERAAMDAVKNEAQRERHNVWQERQRMLEEAASRNSIEVERLKAARLEQEERLKLERQRLADDKLAREKREAAELEQQEQGNRRRQEEQERRQQEQEERQAWAHSFADMLKEVTEVAVRAKASLDEPSPVLPAISNFLSQEQERRQQEQEERQTWARALADMLKEVKDVAAQARAVLNEPRPVLPIASFPQAGISIADPVQPGDLQVRPQPTTAASAAAASSRTATPMAGKTQQQKQPGGGKAKGSGSSSVPSESYDDDDFEEENSESYSQSFVATDSLAQSSSHASPAAKRRPSKMSSMSVDEVLEDVAEEVQSSDAGVPFEADSIRSAPHTGSVASASVEEEIPSSEAPIVSDDAAGPMPGAREVASASSIDDRVESGSIEISEEAGIPPSVHSWGTGTEPIADSIAEDSIRGSSALDAPIESVAESSVAVDSAGPAEVEEVDSEAASDPIASVSEAREEASIPSESGAAGSGSRGEDHEEYSIESDLHRSSGQPHSGSSGDGIAMDVPEDDVPSANEGPDGPDGSIPESGFEPESGDSQGASVPEDDIASKSRVSFAGEADSEIEPDQEIQSEEGPNSVESASIVASDAAGTAAVEDSVGTEPFVESAPIASIHESSAAIDAAVESSIAAEVERSLAVDSSAGLIDEEEAATDAEVASDAVPASVEDESMREEYEEVTGDASNLYTEEEEVGEGGEDEADRALQSVMTSRSAAEIAEDTIGTAQSVAAEDVQEQDAVPGAASDSAMEDAVEEPDEVLSHEDDIPSKSRTSYTGTFEADSEIEEPDQEILSDAGIASDIAASSMSAAAVPATAGIARVDDGLASEPGIESAAELGSIHESSAAAADGAATSIGHDEERSVTAESPAIVEDVDVDSEVASDVVASEADGMPSRSHMSYSGSFEAESALEPDEEIPSSEVAILSEAEETPPAAATAAAAESSYLQEFDSMVEESEEAAGTHAAEEDREQQDEGEDVEEVNLEVTSDAIAITSEEESPSKSHMSYSGSFEADSQLDEDLEVVDQEDEEEEVEEGADVEQENPEEEVEESDEADIEGQHGGADGDEAELHGLVDSITDSLMGELVTELASSADDVRALRSLIDSQLEASQDDRLSKSRASYTGTFEAESELEPDQETQEASQQR